MSPLDDSLLQVTQDLGGFIELLAEEARHLVSGDSERLAAAIAQRDAISSRLALHWRTLAALLDMPANAGLAALKARGQTTVSAAAWRQLETLALEAEHLNRVNGRLLEEQMRRTQAAMQVLQNALASRSLYGADGRVSGFPEINRRIDEA